MFFKHYVRIGEESVFRHINQYFTVVETNECSTLYLYRLLWLHGNMTLASVLREVVGDDQTAYWERVIQYIDSVFTEVRLLHSPSHLLYRVV